MNGIAVFDQHSQEYDRWFEENERLYQAEVNALRKLVAKGGFGVEIGVGTGRFAQPLGIRVGVEPARQMAVVAHNRGVAVCQALGEQLPFHDEQFDFALLVTLVCFVKDVHLLFRETRRVLRTGGQIIVGFIDRDSALGQLYAARKDTDKFYRHARFYAPGQIVGYARQTGFGNMRFCQTIFGLPPDTEKTHPVRDGYGEGAFVVLGATKPSGKEPHVS